MALNVWGGWEPRIRDGVRGEAISLHAAASPETTHVDTPEHGNATSGTYRSWTCEVRLIVSAPGSRPVYVSTRRQMTREKYLIPGLRVPVTVSRRDPTRARIEWDEVPTIDELIARRGPAVHEPRCHGADAAGGVHGGGIARPARLARAEIDGPGARVISFGGGGTAPGMFSDTRKADLLLSVAIPGRDRFGYRWLGKAPRERIVRPGMNIPVLYDPARPWEVDLEWDEIGTTPRELARMACARWPGSRRGGSAALRSARPAGAPRRAARRRRAHRCGARRREGARARPGLMFRRRTERLLSGMGIDPAMLEQARAAMNPETVRARRQYAATLQRVMANGIEMPATVCSFVLAGGIRSSNSRVVHLEMEVEPPSGVRYAASFEQALPETIVSTLAADQRVTVKVAADDPQVLILWNTPHAAGGADPDTGRPLAPAGAAAGDRIARLEQLQRLRDSGVLSEEEFQGQKSRILAS